MTTWEKRNWEKLLNFINNYNAQSSEPSTVTPTLTEDQETQLGQIPEIGTSVETIGGQTSQIPGLVTSVDTI